MILFFYSSKQSHGIHSSGDWLSERDSGFPSSTKFDFPTVAQPHDLVFVPGAVGLECLMYSFSVA